jgi:ribosomal-protein-alanine N-acetyltransferase
LRSDETINQFIEIPENRKTKKIAQAITFIKGVNKYFENNKSVSWESLIKANLELLEQSVCGIFLRTILLPKWAII